MGKKVLISEIDPSLGFLVFPSVMGTMLVENLLSTDENEKLVYFYGDTEIKNKEHWHILKEKVLSNVKECDLHLILEPNAQFEENKSFIVVSDERTYHTVKADKKEFVPCYNYVNKNKTNKLIHDYFHGNEGQYTPIILSDKIKILSVGEKFVPPTSALPLGASRKMDTLVATPVNAEKDCIVAVSYAKEEEIGIRPVSAFLLIKSVKPFTFLCAQMTVAKDALFVQGNVKYTEF